MDGDSRPRHPLGRGGRGLIWGGLIGLAVLLGHQSASQIPESTTEAAVSTHAVSGAALAVEEWQTFLPFPLLMVVALLVGCSAFFSGSESAFFSINKLRLRAMREDENGASRLVARMMDNPGRILTTILVGNMIVNTLIGIFLGSRVERLLIALFDVHDAVAYAIAVVGTTLVLVFFGEVSPKVFAVHTGERFARATVYPLAAVDKFLSPICTGALGLTNLLFRMTRFHELRAAPFITDDEFKSVLTDGEAQGVIEEDERQMIQGILEFSDAMLREILVPRPYVIALPEDTTVAKALEVYREHEYSRMPVYRESLDNILGILLAKDLLPSVAKGDMDRTIKGLLRPAHYVPSTMTVQQFVSDAQRHRAHLAIVVDEYGGSAGIVTLEDAMEQVVGDIMDADEHHEPGYQQVTANEFLVDGGMALDDLSRLMGVDLHDEEHETLAGFLMDLTDKILEPGYEIEHMGLRFKVISCEGKRVSRVRIRLGARDRHGAASGPEAVS